jgi:hypothetical protein
MSLGLPNSRREWFVFACISYLNTPYRWGGDSPLEGLDCSGIVVEAGQESPVGLYPKGFDARAKDIIKSEIANGHQIQGPGIKPGWLVGYGSTPDPDSIYHIEIGLNLDGVVIGARGGGSSTVSDDVALRQDAYVKLGLVSDHRTPFKWYVDPFAGGG